MVSRYSFHRNRRLRHDADFSRIFARRCRQADQRLAVYADGNDTGGVRVGIRVGKRLGNAVIRNRQRRRMREAFRQVAGELPPLDLVCVVQSTDATTCEFAESLLALTRKVADRLKKRHLKPDA